LYSNIKLYGELFSICQTQTPLPLRFRLFSGGSAEYGILPNGEKRKENGNGRKKEIDCWETLLIKTSRKRYF